MYGGRVVVVVMGDTRAHVNCSGAEVTPARQGAGRRWWLGEEVVVGGGRGGAAALLHHPG